MVTVNATAYPGSQNDYGGGAIAVPMMNYLVTSSTAALENVTNAINTTDKFLGKQVYNESTGVVVFADGGSAASKWAEADGTDEHTPV